MARPLKAHTTSDVCADCSTPDPSWGSINRGVLVCDECSSVHRSLGRHVSEVRSMKTGYWTPSLSTMVRQLYASGANNIWEYALMDPTQNKHSRRKPHANDPLHTNKSTFIRMKYELMAFLNKQKDGDICTVEDLSRQLHSSVRTNNLETCLRLLSKGADPNYFYPERGNCPIHVAAQAGQSLQVELLVVYGADPGAPDKEGTTPLDYAVCDGHLDLADRLVECQYQLTDRLSHFLCNRNPDHKGGQHFLIPEVAENNLDLSDLAKQARKKLQALTNILFEELAKDVYDEVDRRENDIGSAHRIDHTSRSLLLHLPVNPEFSATRNQGRQKLATLSPREFATLIIDILNDAKRRQFGSIPSPKDSDKDDIYHKPSVINRVSSSEEEPIYDVVAEDDDASSVDTVSIRSQLVDSAITKQEINQVQSIRPASHVSLTDNDSVASDQQDVSLPISEYRNMLTKLQTKDENIQSLTQTNQDLLNQVSFLKSQIEKLQVVTNPAKDDGDDGNVFLCNGYTSVQQVLDGSCTSLQQVYRSGVRPQSMFMPRTEHSKSENNELSGASSVTNVRNKNAPSMPLTKPPSLPDSLPRRDSDYGYSTPSLCNSVDAKTMGEVMDQGTCDGFMSGIFDSDLSLTKSLPTQDETQQITEKISRNIRELMQHAQEKCPSRFPPCADSICSAVQEMLELFPKTVYLSCEVKQALHILMSNALELQSACTECACTDINHETLQINTKRVIQYAYDVAMAAREVVSQLPEERGNI